MSDEAKRQKHYVDGLRNWACLYNEPDEAAEAALFRKAADLIERQATAFAEVEALHQPFLVGHGNNDDGLPTYVCASCCEATVGTSLVCVAEHDHGPGKPICATAAAIERAREARCEK